MVLLLAGCAPGASDPARTLPSEPIVDRQPMTVLWVTDGDTIGVRLDADGPAGRSGATRTVRLLEIDAPETRAPSQPVGCFGPQASAALTAMLPPGSRITGEADRQLLDRYGRTLLYLQAGDLFVNRWLVGQGYARVVLFAPNDRYIGLLRADERKARAAGRGLWGVCP